MKYQENLSQFLLINGNIMNYIKDGELHIICSIVDLIDCLQDDEKIIEFIKENQFKVYKKEGAN